MRTKRLNNNFVLAQIQPGEFWNERDTPVSALFPHFMWVMAKEQAKAVENGISFDEALNTRIAVIILRSVKQGHSIEPCKAEQMFDGDSEFQLTI